jgi:UDP-N-acetylglucosamine:LPS N-acetylglucosamine transferase
MSSQSKKSRDRILAVSSGGGHWVEMLRLLPAFRSMDIGFVTVNDSYRSEVCGISGSRFYSVRDVTRWNKVRWLQTAFQILWIIIKERPDFIISTGALPGYMALRIGKFIGSKTIWIDSIANVEVLSTSGQRIGKHADLWLTQWEHLSKDGGPEYRGAII